MQDAEEAVGESVRVVAGGDAAIAGSDRAAKRVCGHVEAACFEIEADLGGRHLAEFFLPVRREALRQTGQIRAPAGTGDGGDQRRQFTTKIGEQGRDRASCRARFVLVEQSIVGDILVADGLSFFTLEGHDALEPGLERREVVVLAGVLPGLLRTDDAGRQFLDQTSGQLDGTVLGAANLANCGGGIEVW